MAEYRIVYYDGKIDPNNLDPEVKPPREPFFSVLCAKALRAQHHYFYPVKLFFYFTGAM
jgi:hypothetical protein